jgi:hypothetical protein
MFYYAGWVAIFISILIIIHQLSRYTREIFLWTLKISIALIITGWLALLVYLHENIDYEGFQQSMQRAMESIQSFREANTGL